MSTTGWVLLAVVGIAIVGFLVIQTTSGGVSSSSGHHGLLDNIASITGNVKSIGGDLAKIFPSWWGDTPDPTTDNLNSYPSSSGFIDRSTLE